MHTLSPDMPAAPAAAEILAEKASALFDLEERAASGEDMEAVHDMRVASRRFRAALSVFRTVCANKPRRRLARAARTVTRALGAVRDADVFVDEFARMAETARTTDERVALACVIGHRLGERSRDLQAMRATLASLQLSGLRARLRALARGTGLAASRPLGELAESVVRERLDDFLARVPAALVPSASADQHAARIAAKRLRYAVETLRPCFSGSVDETLEALRRFQDTLGELHDRDVFIAAVTHMSGSGELARAGVKGPGLRAIQRRLARERAERFAAFRALAAEWDEERITAAVLGSLPRTGPGTTA